MRAKLAKKLRKQARELTIGTPWAEYITEIVLTKTGREVAVHTLKEGCGRWVYKQLKKGVPAETFSEEK